MCTQSNYTIHGAQHHFGWDNAIPPVETVAPGSTLLFHCMDSSAGQLGPKSTVDDVVALDFGKINPVSGPIYVDGAEPGDALKVTLEGFAPRETDVPRFSVNYRLNRTPRRPFQTGGVRQATRSTGFRVISRNLAGQTVRPKWNRRRRQLGKIVSDHSNV